MNLGRIKALTFDTGGTILDWHTGFRDAFAGAGTRHGIQRDWAKLANALRRRTMQLMLNLGEDGPPAYNFDDAHQFCFDSVLKDEALGHIRGHRPPCFSRGPHTMVSPLDQRSKKGWPRCVSGSTPCLSRLCTIALKSTSPGITTWSGMRYFPARV